MDTATAVRSIATAAPSVTSTTKIAAASSTQTTAVIPQASASPRGVPGSTRRSPSSSG